jgi:hypothetical protein
MAAQAELLERRRWASQGQGSAALANTQLMFQSRFETLHTLRCCCTPVKRRSSVVFFLVHLRHLERQNAEEEVEVRRLLGAMAAERLRDAGLVATLEAKQEEMKVRWTRRADGKEVTCAGCTQRLCIIRT